MRQHLLAVVFERGSQVVTGRRFILLFFKALENFSSAFLFSGQNGNAGCNKNAGCNRLEVKQGQYETEAHYCKATFTHHRDQVRCSGWEGLQLNSRPIS